MRPKRGRRPLQKRVPSPGKSSARAAVERNARAKNAAPASRSTHASTQTNGFSVIGIGAAPDDANAVAEVIENLPDRSALCIIVAPYAGDASMPARSVVLPSSLPITEARPGDTLTANNVYMVSPRGAVAIKAGRFVSPSSVARARPRPPLHTLFTSLGEEFGARAVGVLLSGPSCGSVEVLREMKEQGGTTIVQDPGSALFDGAPREAVAAGVADHVLPPAAIARELSSIAKGRRVSHDGASSDPFPAMDAIDEVEPADEAFRRVLALLKARFQVDLGHYKLTTVRRRVERRMALSHFEQMSAYAEHLRSNPAAVKELHDELFIHVTQFFRDPQSFEALKELVFPTLLKARALDDPIRIWVPGCSTGEEAYSIAIALAEFLEAQRSSAKFQIFATDISDTAIQHARSAIYSETLLNDVSPSRMDRFFDSVTEGYKIKKELRDLCIISRHDVTSNPPFARLDLISCRNVLIYFGQGLQKRILPILHYALKPGGFLWLGHSETPGNSSKLFSPVDKQHNIYSKVPSSLPYLELASTRFITERQPVLRSPPADVKTDLEFQKSADQLVLFKYGPPGVVVNHEFDIMQFRGKTAPFLEPAAGQPTHNLLKMAHRDLLPALRPLLQSAKKQNLALRQERVRIDDGGARRHLDIQVSPLNPLASDRARHFLVLFEEIADGGKERGRRNFVRGNDRIRKKSEDRTKDGYAEQLERELDALREYQQTLIEQSESSQEELTSANEELQATNEEFQSTNEELETAKEGLQSANEELMTMNDELQSRNAELVFLNEKLARGEDRFRLMVESVKDYAIYMLDPSGRISSWNEGARRLKGYEASEILGEHYSRFFLPEDVAADAPHIELERARIEGRLEDEGWRLRKDGSRFFANIVVSRINDGRGTLVGFAKVTRDLTERKRNEEELASREQRFRLMVSGVRDYAIFMLDPEWRIASWNEGARNLKGYAEEEILGKHFSIFYPQEDVEDGKVEREIRAVLTEGRMEDEGWRVRKDGTRFWANVVITRVNDPQGNLIGFTKVTRDLTERKRADEDLRRANESLEFRVQERTKELEQALKTRDDFLSIASHELKTPLTSLKLQLQMAIRNVRRRRGVPSPAEDVPIFERALKQVTALEELIEDLLDISRIQTGRLKLELGDVNLSGLIEEVTARFSDQLTQAHCELELHLRPNLVARWDRRRMSQVLTNLISNALKYAPRSVIRVSLASNDTTAKIVVADSGPGISAAKQATIFERFERAGASPSIAGLGLGLFIARRIVEAHHGTINVESQVGEGAQFVIDLPLIPADVDLEANLGDDHRVA
jgi:two-component system, chemotaxis family, CheB/CheR fusion protein